MVQRSPPPDASGRARRADTGTRRAPVREPDAAPPLPVRHPALLLVALAVATIVVLSVTHAVYDPDQWQHLTVGRFIWEQHRFPTTQLWTWPTYGEPEVDYAWGFEALLWPFWKLGGLTGIYLWRWLATLAAFALVWATARRLGARGFAPLVVIALAAMIYRGRTQARPETVAAVLLAAELLLLEARRHRARVHAAWLVPIAWAWANTHISYYLFFVVLGIHVLASHLPPRRPGAPAARDLWLAGLAAAAISFVNPSGWRTLWQPFEFWLTWRHEPIYQTIGEMAPVVWSVHLRDGLPLVLGLWPLLVLARIRRQGLDRVEAATCVFFTALIAVGQRFVSVYSLVAAVYVARDLDERVRGVRLPRALAGAWPRAALALAACLAVTLPGLLDPGYPVRMYVPGDWAPIGASDFIQRNGLCGRMYNSAFDQGGYLCFRFWPRRDQLPFIGIHQEGSKELRRQYVAAQTSERDWRGMVARYRFDYLVLKSDEGPADSALTIADRDTTWARVFGDDAAYVYVRRDGPFARLAADSAYTVLPAAARARTELGRRTTVDPILRRSAERELLREVAGSPYHGRALDLLANIALFEGRWDDARRRLTAAVALLPHRSGLREKLGLVDLQQGRPREALRWFEAERRAIGYRGGLDFRRGQVAQAEGEPHRAQALYRREIRRGGGNPEVRDSLGAVTRRLEQTEH
jgi:hypothetical protein